MPTSGGFLYRDPSLAASCWACTIPHVKTVSGSGVSCKDSRVDARAGILTLRLGRSHAGWSSNAHREGGISLGACGPIGRSWSPVVLKVYIVGQLAASGAESEVRGHGAHRGSWYGFCK